MARSEQLRALYPVHVSLCLKYRIQNVQARVLRKRYLIDDCRLLDVKQVLFLALIMVTQFSGVVFSEMSVHTHYTCIVKSNSEVVEFLSLSSCLIIILPKVIIRQADRDFTNYILVLYCFFSLFVSIVPLYTL